MKTLKFWNVFVIIIVSISCEKEIESNRQSDLSAEMPGKHIEDMEIDYNNDFYFVTTEIDASIDKPMWSSSFPMKCYLSKKTSEFGEFEILDNDFVGVDEIIFDKNNNLWARSSKTIFLRKGQTNTKVIELSSDDGQFKFFAVDSENNIWAGGSTHGLYKIDSELNVKLFTPENSSLPGSYMTTLNEGKNTVTYDYSNVNKTIHEILCSKGSCPIV